MGVAKMKVGESGCGQKESQIVQSNCSVDQVRKNRPPSYFAVTA